MIFEKFPVADKAKKNEMNRQSLRAVAAAIRIARRAESKGAYVLLCKEQAESCFFLVFDPAGDLPIEYDGFHLYLYVPPFPEWPAVSFQDEDGNHKNVFRLNP